MNKRFFNEIFISISVPFPVENNFVYGRLILEFNFEFVVGHHWIEDFFVLEWPEYDLPILAASDCGQVERVTGHSSHNTIMRF